MPLAEFEPRSMMALRVCRSWQFCGFSVSGASSRPSDLVFPYQFDRPPRILLEFVSPFASYRGRG